MDKEILAIYEEIYYINLREFYKVVEERKKYVRLDAKVNLKYRILERGQPIKESESKDIGGGGIRLHLNEYLSKDTLLELEMTLPAEPQLILAL